jgi:hypothetical protein
MGRWRGKGRRGWTSRIREFMFFWSEGVEVSGWDRGESCEREILEGHNARR